MKITRFEDIEAWQLSREQAQKIYKLTQRQSFARDFALKAQIQAAAGSAMHNIAEGFDCETNLEFTRFLRYAKRSCTEVQSELYLALDQRYISADEFKQAYDYAARTRAAIRGFINYLTRYQSAHNATVRRGLQPLNPEPLNLNRQPQEKACTS